MSKLSSHIRKNVGLRNRLFIQTVSIALVFVSIILFANYSFTGRLYVERAKDEILNISQRVSAYDFNTDNFYQDIAEIESTKDLYIEIYFLPDLLIYSTRINGSLYIFGMEEESPEPKERLLKTIEMPEIIDDGSFFDIKQEINGTAKYLVYNKIVDDTYGVKIYSSLDVIESNAMLTTQYISFFSVIVCGLILLTVLLYQNNLTKPLIHINSVTKKMAGLDFSERCPEFYVRELNELSKNINHLSSALDMSLTDLKEKNIQLESDIKKEQMLDKARSEFISNASHELKTPISIIQGYAEGIKVGIADGGDGVDEYCNIIIEESEKMNNLVLKLLEISQYESGLYHIQKSHFNIASTIESFLKPRVKLLKEKDITLCFNINPNYIGYADVTTINTVLNNYVSNAISHVSENGLILVTCTPAGEKYRVSVFNTGENIRQDDILKIWDSFYRADKSHSRSAGRFGLGLSFVRSIQEMHGNDYGVINRDNGVEFWFDISKALDINE